MNLSNHKKEMEFNLSLRKFQFLHFILNTMKTIFAQNFRP